MSTMDKYEIDLAVRQERYYRDTNRWTDLRRMWIAETSQTRVEISVIKGTVEDWIAQCQRVFPVAEGAGITSPFHSMQPSEILVKDNRGLATTLINIHIRFRHKDVPLELESWAHQQQRFVKVPGASSDGGGKAEWKISRFQAIYIRENLHVPIPEQGEGGGRGLSKEDAEDIRTGTNRTSYQILAWQMRQAGATVPDDLPGYDDEQTWKPLVERNLRWLETGEDD